MPNLSAQLTQIHDYGAVIASPSRRIVATDFLDKVILAHPDAPLLYWKGSGQCLPVPGLPVGEYYRGAKVFQGSLFVWKNNRLKWSSQNDFTEWIPVAQTTSSYVFKLVVPYTKGVAGVESDYLYVDKAAAGLVAGQFLRIDSDPTYSFFEVVNSLPSVGSSGNVSGFHQEVLPGQTKDVFISSYLAYSKGGRLYFDGNAATLEVQRDAVAPTSNALVVAEEFSVPAAGDSVVVKVTSQPMVNGGSYVSVGPTLFNGRAIYYVEGTDLNAGTITLRNTGIGLATPVTHQAGEFIVGQPSVRVKNLSGSVTASGGFLTLLKERYGFTVKPLNLTGAAPVGNVYPTNTEIFTVDANAAGETVNAGSSINGEIVHFETLGDYAYILKKRSVQSVQYVGQDQGTIFIRPEITDEGLIGDYAFVKVGLDQLYFWGNREIYRYSGGNQLTPIALQFTKQLFAELDKNRANQIFGYHNEKNSEVWFVYPRADQPDSGALRVFIYNYLENSCTIDDFPTSIVGLTAAGRVEWATDVIWQSASGSWIAPMSWGPSESWDSIGDDTSDGKQILAASSNQLLNHGEDYNRLGRSYVSEAETTDFDAGDPIAWKYVDTVVLSLQVKAVISPANLNIYVGTKKNFDDPITWSSPKSVQVQGGGNYTTKVNIQKSGKFFRLKISSNTADIQWRISQVRILGRMGGTY